ncbi:MAG: hypothetical protein V4550_12265 [Gemmatimonadota bacterium]
MHLRRLTIGFAFGMLATGAMAGTSGTQREIEVRRIRAHFDSVLIELSARDAHALSPDQQARRQWVMHEVAAYRDRGDFPHNYDFPGQSVPYFTDRKTGTLCAVANLLAKSGANDIVARVTRTNNNVWVAELEADTAFTRWLDANGLTLAEAARIQVPYQAPVSKAEVARNAGFAVVAVAAVPATLVASLWNATGNADGHRGGVTRTGMVVGAISTALGATILTKNDFNQGIGQSMMALGVTSMVLSTRSISRHDAIVSEQAARARAVAATASVSPTFDVHNGAGARLAVSIGF